MSKGQHGWYTPEEKMHHVEAYLSSNLSLTEYSNKTELCRSTLATWLRHYNSANLIAQEQFQNVTPIIKSEISSASSNDIKLTLPNGIVLDFDVSLLSKVIEGLK